MGIQHKDEELIKNSIGELLQAATLSHERAQKLEEEYEAFVGDIRGRIAELEKKVAKMKRDKKMWQGGAVALVASLVVPSLLLLPLTVPVAVARAVQMDIAQLTRYISFFAFSLL